MRPGTRLGHYEVVSALGKGGMGEVWRGRDTTLGREVAIKVLPTGAHQDRAAKQRFLQEARAASALDHTNICTVYEVNESEDGQLYLVMAYYAGETVKEIIDRGPLPLDQAVQIATQIAAGLSTAHASGIVHRDIKPANLIVLPDGTTKILDFGLAKLTQPVTVLESVATWTGTDARAVVGTVQYMSPEQARGERLDQRTDVFSLGVVLYEMITGSSPFAGDSQAETFARILEREPVSLRQHRPDAPASLERIVGKALHKDRSERYQTAREVLHDLSGWRQSELEEDAGIPKTRSLASRQRPTAGIALASLLVLAGVWSYVSSRPALTDRDTIVLADFINTTGDSVFDGALKQGLAVQLEQSPFLDVFSDARIRQTLRLMGRSPDENVTKDLARDICLRAGLKAFLVGSIAALGSSYVLGLEAVNSQTGDVIARTQVEATRKEDVLRALDDASDDLRRQLGESLSSLQTFDAPLAVTTPSLEALKAYSVGYDLGQKGKYLDAIPFLRQALELDPNFAYAYHSLAASYLNARQPALVEEPSTKAFALSDRVTAIERFRITTFYYLFVTGEVDRASEALELYRQTYPRDYVAASNLSSASLTLGLYEKGVDAGREALRLNSPSGAARVNLSENLLRLNRFGESQQIASAALEEGFDSSSLRRHLYQIAFVNGDTSAMQRVLDVMNIRPDAYMGLAWQAEAAAVQGRWQESQELWRRADQAAGSVEGVDLDYLARQRFNDAVLGRCADARRRLIETGGDEDVLEDVGLADALCGDVPRAETAIREMTERFPQHTLVTKRALPVVRAALQLNHHNPQAAVDLLEQTRRFEASGEFRPQYLRGLAYLELQSASAAAAEFRRILEHRGQAPLSVLYPLAQLGVARSAALAGDAAGARKAYDDFFELWKNADRNLIPLQAAEREYQQFGR